MDSNTLSKGCFVFVPKSSKNKKKKQTQNDEFEDFMDLPRLKLYRKIISDIEKESKKINNNASDEVLQELLNFISKRFDSDFVIPTAVLLTGVNLPDHHVLFEALRTRLNEEVTQHVAVLLSSECSTVKNTIEQLTSQFMKYSTTSLDTQMDVDSDSEEENGPFDEVKRSQCTMPNLVKWYEELKKQNSSPKKDKINKSFEKLVVIFPDFEAFSTKVLQDVILILSGYLDRLPLVLVFGVATSVKALQSTLPHRITTRMDVQMFHSKQSVHFLNSTVNEVLLSHKKKNECPFLLGPKLCKFLTDVFIFYDFSVHGFINGVKYCLMDHFYKNMMSLLCCYKQQIEKTINGLTEDFVEYIGESKSFRKYIENLPKEKTAKILRGGKYFKKTMLELMTDLQNHKHNLLVGVWLLHSLVHDLPEAPLGKQVREVYIEVISGPILENPKFQRCFQLLNMMSKQELLMKIDGMSNILAESNSLNEVHDKLQDLRFSIENAGQNINSPVASPSKQALVEACSAKKISRKSFLENIRKTPTQLRENEFEQQRSKLLQFLKTKVFQVYLVSLTTLPLHEVILIDNMAVKRQIVGAPRAALHTALTNPHHYLQCGCCKTSTNDEILPTMPDICIVYKLHLESGTLINMYDWLQSFVSVVSSDDSERDERLVDPALQARFTRAVAELQFLGFIKASKKKTDHVARLTW